MVRFVHRRRRPRAATAPTELVRSLCIITTISYNGDTPIMLPFRSYLRQCGNSDSNQKIYFVRGVFSLLLFSLPPRPFPSFPLTLTCSHFPLSFPRQKVSIPNPAKGRGKQHLQPPDMFSGLNTSNGRKRIFNVFRANGMCLLFNSCKYRPISGELNLEI